MRCRYCPTSDRIACPGLDVRRFCALIDPECPRYDPAYVGVILSEAHRRSGPTAGRPGAESAHRIIDDTPTPNPAPPIQIAGDCCGGGVLPGIFDVP
jgi:hypothetical protein